MLLTLLAGYAVGAVCCFLAVALAIRLRVPLRQLYSQRFRDEIGNLVFVVTAALIWPRTLLRWSRTIDRAVERTAQSYSMTAAGRSERGSGRDT